MTQPEEKIAFILYQAGELDKLKGKVELDLSWEPRPLNKEQKLDAAKTNKMNDTLKASMEAEGYIIHYYV